MRHASIPVVFGLICGIAAGPASAQSAPPAPSWLTQPSDDLFLVSRLTGLEVYNSNGQDLGDITEVLIDHSGKAQAIVLSVGGVLGVGERNVAVPFALVKFSPRWPAATSSENATIPPSNALGELSLSPVPTGVPPESAHTPSNVPERVIIDLSPDQLMAAPAFSYKP